MGNKAVHRTQKLLRAKGTHNELIHNKLFKKLKETSFKDINIVKLDLEANYENNFLIINLNYEYLYEDLLETNFYSYWTAKTKEFKKEYKYPCNTEEESITKLNGILEKWTGEKNFIDINSFVCEQIIQEILKVEKERIHTNYLQYAMSFPINIVKACIEKLKKHNYIYISKKGWIFVTPTGENRIKEKYPDFLSYSELEEQKRKEQEKEEQEKEEQERLNRKKEEQKRKSHNYSFNLFNHSSNQKYFDLFQMNQKDLNEKSLKAKYRTLCKQYHPDTKTGNQEMFVKVQNAYDYLKNLL